MRRGDLSQGGQVEYGAGGGRLVGRHVLDAEALLPLVSTLDASMDRAAHPSVHTWGELYVLNILYNYMNDWAAHPPCMPGGARHTHGRALIEK